MDQNSCLRLVEETLRLTPNTLNATMMLKQVEGWDSLALVELMAAVDEQLGKTIDIEKVGGCQTVGDLINTIIGNA